jgi:hypothetical protein
MRIVVSGDRDWSDEETVAEVLEYCLLIAEESGEELEVIHGNQGKKDGTGLDKMAGRIAKNLGAKVTAVPAEWDRYPRGAAGPIRNKKMLDMDPSFLIAFHADLKSSRGTKNCVKEALKRKIPVALVENSEAVLFSGDPASRKEIERNLQ